VNDKLNFGLLLYMFFNVENRDGRSQKNWLRNRIRRLRLRIQVASKF